MKFRVMALSAIVAVLLAGCGMAATTEDSAAVAVVKAFYAAENADDLEAAMALIADDAVFTFPLYGKQEGTAKIREWEQFSMKNGGEFELSDMQAAGDTVTFTAKFLWMGSRIEHDYEVIVQDGKITSLTAR